MFLFRGKIFFDSFHMSTEIILLENPIGSEKKDESFVLLPVLIYF